MSDMTLHWPIQMCKRVNILNIPVPLGEYKWRNVNKAAACEYTPPPPPCMFNHMAVCISDMCPQWSVCH